jgi:hypothetical protein
MGLDQYAYVAHRQNQQRDFYDGAEFNPETREYENKTVEKPREIAYWRKHPNLQGWMERIWREKKYTVQIQDASEPVDPDSDMFNGVEIELTWEDLEQLERDITSGEMESLGTRGFFFGDPSDDYYREHDLKFIKEARAELFSGFKVFYNSSW